MKYKLVKDLMTSPAIYCEEKTSIKDIILKMKESNIGFIPITNNDILVGVVTDRDIAIRLADYRIEDTIDKIMTCGNIYFVNPNTPLEEAAKTMSESKIRRLVVLNDGKITGVLTSKNLLLEPNLIHYVMETYLPEDTIKEYRMYTNSNPHDSVKTSDFPL